MQNPVGLVLNVLRSLSGCLVFFQCFGAIFSKVSFGCFDCNELVYCCSICGQSLALEDSRSSELLL